MQNMVNLQNMQNMHNIRSKQRNTLNCVTKYCTGLFSKGVQHHGQLNSWPLIGLSTLALDPVLVPSFRRFTRITTHIDTIPISYNVACTVPHAMILFSCHDIVTFLVAIWEHYNCLCQVPARPARNVKNFVTFSSCYIHDYVATPLGRETFLISASGSIAGITLIGHCSE
jgi:hypothetical protein